MTATLAARAGQRPADVAPIRFSPRVLPGLQAWYAADRLNLADGAAVASWEDGSDNTNDVVQAVAGKRPTFVKSSPLNGQPAVLFDGLTQFLQVIFGVALTQPTTVIAVVKYVTASTLAIFFDGAGAEREAVYIATPAGVPHFAIYASGAQLTAVALADTNPHVMAATFDGVNSSLSIDGQVVASGNTGPDGLGGITLGLALDGSSFPANVYLSEVILCAPSLGAADIDRATRAMGRKYGVSIP